MLSKGAKQGHNTNGITKQSKSKSKMTKKQIIKTGKDINASILSDKYDADPCISVVDGRYKSSLDTFRLIVSDAKYYAMRVIVEMQWLCSTIEYINTTEDSKLNTYRDDNWKQHIDQITKMIPMHTIEILESDTKIKNARRTINKIYEEIREIEITTQHDVKAIEYWIKEKVPQKYSKLIHIGLTSQDINSVAMSCIMQDAIENIIEKAKKFISSCDHIFNGNVFNVEFMERTHGQIAVKGNMRNYLCKFILPIIHTLTNIQMSCDTSITAKFSSSTGDYTTLLQCFDNIETIKSLQHNLKNKLGHNKYTFSFNDYARQTDDYSSYVSLIYLLKLFVLNINNLMDQIWHMVSRGNIVQKKVAGEIGSSVMPQKVNPWRAEQARSLANRIDSGLGSAATMLMSLRDARDMSDSSTIRFVHENMAEIIILMETSASLISRLAPNTEYCAQEIRDNPQCKAEAIQTSLRIVNYEGNPYEETAAFFKGRQVTQNEFNEFVDSYSTVLSEETRDYLKNM